MTLNRKGNTDLREKWVKIQKRWFRLNFKMVCSFMYAFGFFNRVCLPYFRKSRAAPAHCEHSF